MEEIMNMTLHLNLLLLSYDFISWLFTMLVTQCDLMLCYKSEFENRDQILTQPFFKSKKRHLLGGSLGSGWMS